MSDMVDLTNVDLGVENLGEPWEDFISRCIPEQATLFNESYNLIAISFPDGFVDTEIQHLFTDEGLETAELIAHIRLLFIETILDALQKMGISFDRDYLDMNSLNDLKVILDTMYLADGMTDLIGLVQLLTDEEQDTKSRFVTMVRLVMSQYELDNMEDYIREVSPETIRGLLIGLNIIDEDDTEYVDPDIQKRIKVNKVFLLDTFGGEHVLNDGGLGLDVDGYFKVFMSRLAQMLVKDKVEYHKNILSLMIISSLSDAQVHGQFSSLVNDQCEEVEELYKSMDLLKKVNLNA